MNKPLGYYILGMFLFLMFLYAAISERYVLCVGIVLLAVLLGYTSDYYGDA